MHSQRNFGLDCARALAISMVFLSHGITALDTLGVGVDLFFVLSGFLIGRIYLRQQADASTPGLDTRGTFTLWGFWSARWFRTLPPYLAALALFALANTHFGNNPIHLDYLLFLQNYLGMDGFGPSWSLCVEEHFYLALPLLGYLALKLPASPAQARKHLLWLLPALALIPEILRNLLPLPPNWYWRTHLHAEGLILGVWLAYLFVHHRGPDHRTPSRNDGTRNLPSPRDLWQALRIPAIPLATLPLALLAYQFLHPIQPMLFQKSVFLLYAIGYAAWLRLFYDLRWTPTTTLTRLLHRAITGLALASYSIYLLHTLLFTDIRVLLATMPRGPLKTAIILTSTLALSAAFYFAVERPTIRLRDRLLRHR